ncbi:MAG: lysine--tRNA ligase [Candidatus Aenigmatarchaeota archaeon]|nr:MAG: lysine--tRNA ligase [Candidatus Aenigmarchaeota archaeon]
MPHEKPIEELMKERRQKLEEIRKLGFDPFGQRFERTHKAKDILSKFGKIKPGEKLEKEKVSLAGRIRSIRRHGKLVFAHIEDFSGRIQIFVEYKTVGKKLFNLMDKLNAGDFVGVNGFVFKTLKGETSVWVKSLNTLCKSLRPLPAEWYGLKDVETRYRRRYVDFIVNPRVKNTFIKRSEILKAIRQFLNEKDFIEITTPTLQPVYGGAFARPFTTYHNELERKLYLRISPELYLKRALVGGFEKVYEICVNFRNEGIDTRHNPEFTMLELYWAYVDYKDNMKLTEDMFEYVAKKVLGTMKIDYQGKKIDLKPPWKKITMYRAIKKHLGVNVESENLSDLKAFAKEKGIPIPDYFNKGMVIASLFDLVEPKLVQPTFITDFPIDISPLAKAKRDNPSLAERYELIINGQECANAYTEENDPDQQRKKFEEQMKLRKKGDEEAHMMDEDFIQALEYGMPPASGNGIGIDRLVMLLTNSPSIRDVIAFPTLREKI